jgi:hypothetical protein
MRRLAVAGPILLALCATSQPPVHGETTQRERNAAGAEQFVSQSGTSETGAAIMRASHAAILRWAPPCVMLTMDFREDRVTVWLDPAGKITRIRCG